MTRILVPFAVGVAVGIAIHKYWPQIREFGGPGLARGLKGGSGLFDRARTAFWEKSEQFADLVAEIREEESAGKPPPAPPAPEVPA